MSRFRFVASALVGLAGVAACGSDDGGAPFQATVAGAPGVAGSGAGSAGMPQGTAGSAGSVGGGGAAGSGGAAAGQGGAAAGTGGTAGATAGSAGTGGAGPLLGAHAKLITVNTTATGAATTAAVVKYPLALKLDATNFDFASSTETGADLRFTKPDGTALPHAVESFDKAGQSALVWVLVDSVPPNSSAPLVMMHWGNLQAADIGDSKAVFNMDTGFAGVWHLNEPGSTTAGGFKDATARAANGTGHNLAAASRVPGVVGSGTKLVHSQQQWVEIAHDDAFDQTVSGITISIWVLATSFPTNYETIMSKGDTSWTLQHEGSGEKFEPCVFPTVTPETPDHRCVVSKATVATNKWFHFVVSFKQPTIMLYINGALDGMRSEGVWQTADHPIALGYQTQFSSTRHWDGILDEARVMTGARDLDWAKLDYASQVPMQSVVTYGATVDK